MEPTNRDLPPPSGLARLPPVMSTPLPPPPSQWQGTEFMQQWLMAKAEEDRRRQEEERTRQESLRLERRKVEQTILSESLRAGIPPHMMPLIFSGMDSGRDSSRMLDTLQQCISHAPPSAPAQAPFYRQVSNPGVPVPLPHIPQQPQQPQQPRQATPLESQSDWQKRMEAYFGRKPVHKKPTSGKKSLQPSTGTTANASTGSPSRPNEGPTPHTPQRPSGLREPQPHRASTSIFFRHWIPPGDSASQSPMRNGQTEASQPMETSSSVRSNSRGSPNRKRKSQISHHKEPPPPRLSNATAKESRPDVHSPTGMVFHNYGPGRPYRQQSDASTLHESQTTDGDSDQVLEIAARSRTDPDEESIKSEDDIEALERNTSNETHSRIRAVSDVGPRSSPSQRATIGTKSDKTADAVQKT